MFSVEDSFPGTGGSTWYHCHLSPPVEIFNFQVVFVFSSPHFSVSFMSSPTLLFPLQCLKIWRVSKQRNIFHLNFQLLAAQVRNTSSIFDIDSAFCSVYMCVCVLNIRWSTSFFWFNMFSWSFPSTAFLLDQIFCLFFLTREFWQDKYRIRQQQLHFFYPQWRQIKRQNGVWVN